MSGLILPVVEGRRLAKLRRLATLIECAVALGEPRIAETYQKELDALVERVLKEKRK